MQKKTGNKINKTIGPTISPEVGVGRKIFVKQIWGLVFMRTFKVTNRYHHYYQ